MNAETLLQINVPLLRRSLPIGSLPRAMRSAPVLQPISLENTQQNLGGELKLL
jgi:hypothetical protein